MYLVSLTYMKLQPLEVARKQNEMSTRTAKTAKHAKTSQEYLLRIAVKMPFFTLFAFFAVQKGGGELTAEG